MLWWAIDYHRGIRVQPPSPALSRATTQSTTRWNEDRCMTSVHRSRLTFHNIGSSHVAVFRQTAQDPTHSCKFTKWRHERCQAQRVIVKIVRKPKQPCCANTVMPYSCGLTTQLSKTPNAQIPIGQADPSMIKLEPVSCLSASPTPSNTHAQFKRSRVASEKPASMQPSACSRLWLHSTSASTVFAKRTSKTLGHNHRLMTDKRT